MTTPQFARCTHRARGRLAAVARRWPDAWRLVDEMRAERADTWPEYVYLPLPAASAVITEQRRRMGMPPKQGRMVGAQVGDALELATLAAWRMTQGIYRYDPSLYAAVIDTPLAGDIPASVLRRLPEWCVYVETPGMEQPMRDGTTAPCHGAWAWMDHDERGPHDTLMIGWDVDAEALPGVTVPLVGTLDAAADTVIAQWMQGAVDHATDSLPPDGLREAYMRTLPPILSLLLYLCSESPDLTRRGQPAAPANPEPARTRRTGWRLFPADGPREWDVGVRIGAALRAAYAREETGGEAVASGRHVRPHVRRAHWHTILSGARKRDDGTVIPASEQRRDLRWMPPIPVAITDLDALPAVVHRVRQ